MKVLEYSSNNSGGGWWLTDQNWRDLEKAGWVVDWQQKRFLGALATEAKREIKENETLSAILLEFEKITGEDISDEGCSCCGCPHNFTYKSSGEKDIYFSGDSCLQYMYNSEEAKLSKRELLERL